MGSLSTCLQAISSDKSHLVLTVEGTTLAANATAGNFGVWPVVTVYNSAGLPALPWAPTSLSGTCASAN